MNLTNFLKKKFKPIIAGILAILLTPTVAFAVENWKMVSNGVYKMNDEVNFDKVLARGIDVSRWQGEIDWKKVANDDVKFAMVATRSRQTGTLDPYFTANMNGAMNNGVKLGAYIYSYALTVEEAKAEAEFVLNAIKDYPISYPIAFDVEDENTQGKMSKEEISALIDAFCKTIQDAGYYPIIYASDYWLSNKLDPQTAKKYPVWVARYNKLPVFQNPVMWQGTSSGKVDGIAGNVDLDFQYTSFEDKIKADTWRTILGERYYYKNYKKQVSTWAKDVDTWYYLNSNGNPTKGWITLANKEYYLNPDTGAMVTGWLKSFDKWNYFGNDGSLTRGWIKDNDSWYFLDKNGYMLTDWIKESSKYYYLNADGSMAKGWIKQNNTWFYLGNDGSMRTNWVLDNGTWYYLDKSGNMMTGWVNVSNKLYNLAGSGKLNSGWILDNGNWYFSNEDGAIRNGWINDNGNWYFLEQSGKMLTGLVNIDNKNYYFNNSGQMLHDTSITLGEQSYNIASSGEIIDYNKADISITSVNSTVLPEQANLNISSESSSSEAINKAFDTDNQKSDNIIRTQTTNNSNDITLNSNTSNSNGITSNNNTINTQSNEPLSPTGNGFNPKSNNQSNSTITSSQSYISKLGPAEDLK